jgi:translocation and assembly module TamB
MRRLLLIVACVLVVVALVAPAMLVWWVLYTPAGLQFVLRHVPQQLGDVHLEIAGVRGTVAHGLTAERVEIDHHLVHLRVEGIEGRVALAPLLLQTIRVSGGKVQSALIQVKRRTRPATPGGGPPQFLPRWLMINVEEGRIGQATLTVYTGFRLEARELLGAAIIRHNRMRFFQANGVLAGAHVSASGELRAADPLGMEVKGHLDWNPPEGQPNWTLAGSARGDLNALNLVAHVVSPFRADVSGQGLDLTNHWHFVAAATVQDFDLHAFGPHTPLGHISGHLAGTFDEHGFTAHGPLNPAGLHAGVFDTRFAGRYAARVLSVAQLEVHHRGSGARATATGTITVAEPGPRLALQGSWSNFRWPLSGKEAAVESPAGSYTLAGGMPYALHLAGSGRGADLPSMPVELDGALDKDSLVIDRAALELFGGHASVTGRVEWSPAPSWWLAGRATGINPAALRADLPGNVSFTFGATGGGFDARSDVSASFSGLTGTLRRVAASGAGTVTHSATGWGFSNVRVGLGSASLSLDGRIGERLALRFGLAAKDLNLIAHDMRGEVRASGTLGGTLADPVIVASVHGSGFAYQEMKLGAVDAEINFTPGAMEQESKIDVELRALHYRNRTLQRLALTLRGPPTDYEVRLSASARGLAAAARSRGAYTHGAFNGELNSLTVSGSEQLHLSLERPVGLSVSLAHARLEWLCLVGTPGSVCADGDWAGAAWTTTLMARDLPLNTLTAGMTPAVEYVGTLSALAYLSGGANRPVQGQLRVQLADAAIDHKLASRKVERTRIGSGNISLIATDTLLSAQLELGEGGAATLRGRLDAQRIAPAWQDMPVTGELHCKTSELALLSLYAPDIDRAAGALETDIHLAGTAGAPQLTGTIKLDNGEIDVYSVNLSLRQITLQARLSDSGFDFNGSAHSGPGAVTASGHLEWRNLLPYGKFHLVGTDLRVADLPEAQIDASPALDFTVTGHRIEVTGKVVVPQAKIQPADITAAVRASADEQIVGSEPADVSQRFEVVSTVTLVLGDHVNVDAMGLTARLTGSVTVRSGYDTITHGSGELSVAEGQYTAYARKLDITRGRLIFTGGPIDNPGIDVRAQKQFPDVTAGVNVRGTLLQPRMSFFSDPPLPQSQIVSLILAGGSLQSAQNAGNAAVGQGAALLAAELGSQVGLPDVSLETDPIANETSLVLGHYLSPRLYVSYGVALTEQLNVLKMRYTLGDHWTVRIEIGQARGADLVYTIERK